MFWQKAVRRGLVSPVLVEHSSWEHWQFEDFFFSFFLGVVFLCTGIRISNVLASESLGWKSISFVLVFSGMLIFWVWVRNILALPILSACKKLHRYVIPNPGLYSFEDLQKGAREVIMLRIARVINLEASGGQETPIWQEARVHVKDTYNAAQAFHLFGRLSIGDLYKEAQAKESQKVA